MTIVRLVGQYDSVKVRTKVQDESNIDEVFYTETMDYPILNRLLQKEILISKNTNEAKWRNKNSLIDLATLDVSEGVLEGADANSLQHYKYGDTYTNTIQKFESEGKVTAEAEMEYGSADLAFEEDFELRMKELVAKVYKAIMVNEKSSTTTGGFVNLGLTFNLGTLDEATSKIIPKQLSKEVFENEVLKPFMEAQKINSLNGYTFFAPASVIASLRTGYTFVESNTGELGIKATVIHTQYGSIELVNDASIKELLGVSGGVLCNINDMRIAVPNIANVSDAEALNSGFAGKLAYLVKLAKNGDYKRFAIYAYACAVLSASNKFLTVKNVF